MSIKNKIAAFLFGEKPGEPAAGVPPPQQDVPEQAAQAASAPPPDPALLKLSGDHPIHQLYDLRRKEAGELPAPRLSLDEDGVLPEDMVRREKNKLLPLLKSICGFRLREVRQKKKGGKGTEKEGEDEGPVSVDAFPWFFLSSNKLYAWVLVFPPMGQGKELTRGLLYQALEEQGISYGVDSRLIDRLSRDEDRYFHLFLIAKGKPAFDGRNGNIVDYFPRSVERVLQVDEFDQVDYAALDLIHNVQEGQEICRLIRPTEGEPGRTVLDQEIPAKSGKTVPLPKGKNTEISEDGDALVALVSGHVEFSNRSFQVKPVFEVPGNVDFSTGNISFLGDVNIKGDVLSGFSVQAAGNIWVGGVIEAGSTVEAGGDLTVVKGILGDGTTTVQAHRCIFSKYIENSTIYVQENLQTDCIVNSNIYCDGEVLVRSGRGNIMGGRVWAAKKVSATIVGSKSECKTVIALGGSPCIDFERDLIRREMKDLTAELEKLDAQLDSPIKASLLSKVHSKLSAAELRMKQLDDALPNVKQDPREKNEGRLECSIAYAGTELNFGDEVFRMRQESRQCIAKMVCGEIVVM